MKVSFDFDDCLTRRPIQKLAKTLVQRGDEVFIVTSRGGTLNTNKDVEVIAYKIGIKHENIIFVGDWKWTYFKSHPEFNFHIDDYYFEIETINEFTDVQAFPCDLTLFFKEYKL